MYIYYIYIYIYTYIHNYIIYIYIYIYRYPRLNTIWKGSHVSTSAVLTVATVAYPL